MTAEDEARGKPTHTPSVASMHEGYEVKDLPARGLAMILVTFAVSAALLVGIVFLLIGLFTGWDSASTAQLTAVQTATLPVPAPHLQLDAVADLDHQRAREAAALHGYAWTDPGRTRAHVPIERAKALVIGQSLDAAP
jgi:hypothetical protein